MAYDNTNRGAIWGAKERKTDKHPHFNGHLDVEGRKYRVVAWKRAEGANPNAPALTFKIEPEKTNEEKMKPQPVDLPFDDDLPF